MPGTVTRAIFIGTDHDPKWIVENRDELPNIEEGEVLIRIRLATICGSDIHTIRGTRMEPTPLVLGHEAVGEVVQDRRKCIRPERPLNPGTRVTFSVGASCMKCERCRLKLPEKCESLLKIGHMSLNQKSGFNGCYATHLVLPRGTHVISVPRHLSDRMVAPINCALATMVNATEKARTETQNKSALVLGAGLLGLYGCALLHEKGYKHIYCSDVDRERLKFVSKFGADAIHSDQFLDNDFLADSMDTVIEVCGNPNVIQDGFRRLRYGGVYVLVGLVHPNSHLSLTGEQIIRKCITIKGVHNYSPRHLDEALEFLSKTSNQYPYEELLSPNEFNLDQIDRAVTEADTRIFHRSCIRPLLD